MAREKLVEVNDRFCKPRGIRLWHSGQWKSNRNDKGEKGLGGMLWTVSIPLQLINYWRCARRARLEGERRRLWRYSVNQQARQAKREQNSALPL